MRLPKIVFLALLLLVGCKGQSQNVDSLYVDPQLWYRDANKAGDRDFDVFYLLPTCVRDRVAANGDTLHYADPRLESDRKAMRPSFEIAEQIFGGQANFYSPYYSQITLESWRSEGLAESRFARSLADVKQAFDYYMQNVNNGRPFVLAGFSQGGKCVVELLKTLTPKQYSQMVAAYVVGYKVTAEDTLIYKQIKLAEGPTDAGVVICYNSVANLDAINPMLSSGVACINPIDWTTSAMKSQLNDTVTVQINKQHNVLVVDGFNPDNYYVKSLAFLFKKGNYHLEELKFYRENLAQNVKRRLLTHTSNR